MAEKTLILGADKHLVATFASASPLRDAPRVVAILTNSGVIPRGGPHRMNVHLARQLGAMGIPSVRFDMSGLGDSQRSNGTLSVTEQWVADTRAVMDAAQERFSCDRFLMVGFCSGAEVAHLVALEDPRLRAVLLWDLYAYRTLQSEVRRFLFRFRRVGLLGAARKAIDRLTQLVQRPKSSNEPREGRAAEISMVPPKKVFERRIDQLTASGVEVFFLYCGGEPEWFNYRGQFKAMFGQTPFYKKVAFDYLESSDHLITTRLAQMAFLDVVDHWVQQRVLPNLSRMRDGTVVRGSQPPAESGSAVLHAAPKLTPKRLATD